VQAVEELQTAITQQDALLAECQRRYAREEASLRELDTEIQDLTRQLQAHKAAAAERDTSSKQVFAYYSGYSELIQSIFGIQLEFLVPPARLMGECSAIIQAIFQECPHQPVSFYFSSTGALVQIKVSHLSFCNRECFTHYL